jgi:hypothetical protein
VFGKLFRWWYQLCLVLAKIVQTSSTIQVQKNDNKNSSTPNGSKFVSTKTEQATENQE